MIFRQTILDFLNFVVQPKAARNNIDSVRTKILKSVFLFLVKFCFSIAVASLIGLFYEPQNLTDLGMYERFTPLMYLLVGGVLLPFFEETLFRLSLVFKPLYFSLTAACAAYYVITKLVFGTKLSLVDETFYIRVATALSFGLVCFFLLNRSKTLVQNMFALWQRNFRFIYYGFVVAFAWLHILNFEVNLTHILLTPILTLPQLFSGLISGYLRVNFGFIYPLLLHIFTNSLLIGLSILVE